MLVDFFFNFFNVGIRKKWLVTTMKISHRRLTLLLHYLVKLTLLWMFAWNCGSSASRNARLYHFSRFVASKQSRSQSSWLRNLGCHAASCILKENPHHRRTEVEADWSLVRPWTEGIRTLCPLYSGCGRTLCVLCSLRFHKFKVQFYK